MPSTTAPSLAALCELVKPFPIALVTGGSGYIGSHTVLEILKVGCAVVVVDNLVNSHMEALIRVYHIAKAEYSRLGLDARSVPPLLFHKADLCDRQSVLDIFQLWQQSSAPTQVDPRMMEVVNIGNLGVSASYKMRDYPMNTSVMPELLTVASADSKLGSIVAVIHFAALKAVGDSVAEPLQYYQNNIAGLLNLLDAMQMYKVTRLVFSSSAVVYGTGKEANIAEDSVQVGGKGTGGGLVTNPYGRSKRMVEEILNDCCIANPEFEVVALRYFNPTGSHPSGLIGEDPKGTPNNIVPVILQAYQRRRSKVYVYGSDYSTADRTGVRDYIHVEDLAKGHLAALRSMIPSISTQSTRKHSLAVQPIKNSSSDNYRVYNLGTGQGYSVLDIIKAFASVAGCDIPFVISDARPGDLGAVTASTAKATTELGWQAEFGIQDMCRDVYTFATENPAGYERLRKLSTLALKDPATMRKASIAAGMWQMPTGAKIKSSRRRSSNSGLEDIVEGLTNLSADKTSFDNMLRKMSVISNGSEDLEFDHPIPASFGSASHNSTPPQWGIFGNQWYDEALPVRS